MNSAYKEYLRLAYRRTVLSAVRRYLSDYVASDIPAAKTLVCEEALMSDRDVPEEAFQDVLDDVLREEESLRLQMADFEFRRRERGKPEEPKGGAEAEPSEEPTAEGSEDD